ncbi:Fc receptor-like A [Perognathus longimembris pacificus]|uniref:Fc receptor-like A n=1 Tax=Perognathus longimembris pacificus TaxID=214514 RepID=UPI002019BD7A|nr:Fc receptor-like A [Perognathus longimembris pacificus]
MKVICVLTSWAFYILLAILWASQMLPSASFETTMRCEETISTRGSSCHTDDETTHPRKAGYTFSEPFHLIVSYDWLILQVPVAPIFEGDPLVLHCRAWQNWPLTEVTFYRDGTALGPPGPNKEFSITLAQEADSGHYHCSGIFRSPGPGSPETASTVAITVQELFSAPVLTALPSAEPQEGGPVTLSCQTKLSPQRSAAHHLLFSFYKDGRTLHSRGLSSEFQIPTTSVEHSGSYWCEAATGDGQVWKHSPPLEIAVQGPSSSMTSSAWNPSPQRSATPETSPKKPSEPLPPPPTSSSEHAGFSSLDPHLHHQMRILLKNMQDVRVLLGHVVMELRDLSSFLKSGITKAPDK